MYDLSKASLKRRGSQPETNMAVVSGDIVYFMSGGSGNSNPNNSIGGDPSSSPISGLVNNLFDNISPEETTAGKTDYRCFYIFNSYE